MDRTPRERQRIINVACGYGFFAWGLVTLGWLLLAVNDTLATLSGFLAAVAAFFGTIRALTIRHPRLWIIPVATAAYLLLLIPLLQPGIRGDLDPRMILLATGFVYTIALFPVIRRLVQKDFAQSVPAWLCKQCGYPLVGLREPECPECGTLFDPERVPDVAPPSG